MVKNLFFTQIIYFYSHAPYGTWLIFDLNMADDRKFLLTRPLRDVTCIECIIGILCHISTHTPLTGRDCGRLYYFGRIWDFYSHAPYGTWLYTSFLTFLFKISTHTPLTGRDSNPMWYKGGDNISTHTPLTGRDLNCWKCFTWTLHFYSHAPYGTWPHKIFLLINRWISTHTPLTGRDEESIVYKSLLKISTHTPLTGRDSMSGGTASAVHLFLLTRPLRDVTATFCIYVTEHFHILGRTYFCWYHLYDIAYITYLL